MKTPKLIQIKPAIKLFLGQYKYKVALITTTARWFRSDTFTKIPSKIDEYYTTSRRNKLLRDEDVGYSLELYNVLKNYSGYKLRIEHPILSIYTNDYQLVELLTRVNEIKVKYVSKPVDDREIPTGTILLKRTPYKYKVTFGKTTQSYASFVEWCESTELVKLSKATKLQLEKASWRGGSFYVKTEKGLTMVKIFLGPVITKLETIINT